MGNEEMGVAPAAEGILYAESQGKYKLLYRGRGVTSVRCTMEELQQRLGTGFLRCHRCYLVNRSAVHHIEENDLVLTDGSRVCVSRQHLSEVRGVCAGLVHK